MKSLFINLPCPSFLHRTERRKTERHVVWLFLSIRLSFTCSHWNHPPPLNLCLICPYCLHIFALLSVCATVCVCLGLCGVRVCVPMCVYVWLGQLIPSARKCPAARIWTWESVRCSVDMWHGAKSGMQPLSISMVRHCPFTAKALPETGWECWEKLHIAKNKFEMLQTKTRKCQKLVQNAANNKNNNSKIMIGNGAAHAMLAQPHKCCLFVYCWPTISEN